MGLVREMVVGPLYYLRSEVDLVPDLVDLLDHAVDDLDVLEARLDVFVAVINLFGLLDALALGFGCSDGLQIASFVPHFLSLEQEARERLRQRSSSP